MAGVVQEARSCFCAEYVGNYLYVAAQNKSHQNVIYRYDIVNNSWNTLPSFWGSSNKIKSLCAVDECIYAITESYLPQRYSLANNNWQTGAKLSFYNTSNGEKDILQNAAAVVLNCRIYVIHGYTKTDREGYGPQVDMAAVVHCFDPTKNEWQQKASTCYPHFGSSLFVVNNNLCVAGGNISTRNSNPAPVEVYNEENNFWSVVEQKHIPSSNLRAVEIEGRVYFIINKFPIDSGIRIPPGEVYHVSLNEWGNLAKVSSEAALCYLPVKRENLKTEPGEN